MSQPTVIERDAVFEMKPEEQENEERKGGREGKKKRRGEIVGAPVMSRLITKSRGRC